MVQDDDLREIYRMLADVLDGFNRTHDVQVVYIDFVADCPEQGTYSGSLVLREYEHNIIDFHYRDLVDDDFDWFSLEEWAYIDRSKEVERILAERRKTSQRYHREGRDLSTLWYVQSGSTSPPGHDSSCRYCNW